MQGRRGGSIKCFIRCGGRSGLEGRAGPGYQPSRGGNRPPQGDIIYRIFSLNPWLATASSRLFRRADAPSDALKSVSQINVGSLPRLNPSMNPLAEPNW